MRIKRAIAKLIVRRNHRWSFLRVSKIVRTIEIRIKRRASHIEKVKIKFQKKAVWRKSFSSGVQPIFWQVPGKEAVLN
jgi:hypothetical protein